MTVEIDESRAPLMSHIVELRRRLIVSLLWLLSFFVVGLYFSNELFEILAKPYMDAQASNGGNSRMIFTALQEKFFVNIKVALYAAFMIAFPMIALQIWKFVAPGLYKNEKAAFRPFLVATPVLFALGGSMAYFIVIPWAWEFLLSFQTTMSSDGIQIDAEAKVSEYLSIVMKMIFGFGFAFLMPVGLTLLGRVGIISSEFLRTKRRYMIVLFFVMAAFLTPPDPMSQIALGIPLLVLYEISILLIAMSEKKRKRESEDTG